MLNIRIELIIAFVAIVMGIGVAWFFFSALTPETIMDDLAQPAEPTVESSIEAVVEEVVQSSEPGTDNPTESIVEEIAQSADPSVESLNEDSQEFVNQVQEELSDGGSEVEDWSADALLELLEREKTVGADVTLEDDLQKEIIDAAHRDEIKPRRGDPYLSSLMDEASGLSVTAVNISEGSGLVRNSSQGSRPSDRFIIVEEGDSLSELAYRLYGDPNAYESLFRANQDILISPDMLSVGQRLRVPSR